MGIGPLVHYLAKPFPSYTFEEFQSKLSENPPHFGFVVLGNTCIDADDDTQHNIHVYQKLLDLCATIHPRPSFLFHLGDIGMLPGDMKAWAKLLTLSRPFVVPDALDSLEQNNDGFLLTLPGELDVTDRDSQKAYEQLFPYAAHKVYYSFNFRGVHFVSLDSETVDRGIASRYFGWNRYKNRIIGEQLEWLSKDLAEAAGMPIFVMIHKPFFPPSYGQHEGYCLDQYYFERERVHGLLKKHSVKAVFSAHEPICYCARVDGIHYFISGGAGKGPYAAERLGGYHHLVYVAFYQHNKAVCYALDTAGKVRLELILEDSDK